MQRHAPLLRNVVPKHRFAKRLRSEATDAERRLWAVLRHKQVAGVRFRRQQAIGPYIVDFYCPAAKVVIELDGDQHGEDQHVSYDEARTRWLIDRGYRVLRFPNWQVLRNPQIVIDAIAHEFEIRAVPLPEIRRAIFDPPSTGG